MDVQQNNDFQDDDVIVLSSDDEEVSGPTIDNSLTQLATSRSAIDGKLFCLENLAKKFNFRF